MAFLSPYRVLDLTDERGLLAGKIFADLGADVIQVEPVRGSHARQMGPFRKDGPQNERSLYWEAYACNKRIRECGRIEITRSQNLVPFKGFVQRKGYEMSDDWKQAWQPLIDAVGTDFGSDVEVWGADEVERSTIRRFLEPLEFDCPLHYDRATAEKYGYSDIVAPYSSILTYTLPAMWQPGQHIWTSAERNAQPARSPVAVSSSDPMQKLMPPSPGFFATDIEIDYLQPVVLGDHVRMRGRKLLSCIPKETRVGCGAFITWESEILNQRAELVARIRVEMYQYVPHTSKGE